MKTTRMLWAAALSAAMIGHAHADGGGAAAGDEKPPADPDEDVKARDQDSPWDNLELSGRVYARFEAWDDDINDWLGEMSLPSARLGVKYKWKDRVAAKISFEVRGSVRDAYVDVALSGCLTLRAGRFKLPASAIERTSTWTLPSVDRPIGSDVMGGSLGVVGRHIGAGLIWDPGVGIKPKVEVTVSEPFDVSGLPDSPVEGQRPLSDYAGAGVTVHGEIEPVDGVHLGAFAQNRQVYNGKTAIQRYWTGGVDVEVERGGLRLWADAIAGTGHFGITTAAPDPTPFVVAQTVLGWRQGGKKPGKRYVEPFVLAAYVNPDADRKDDELMQVAGGVAGGRWKRWRAQLQVTSQQAGDLGVPDLGGVDVTYADRLSITTQLSAAF